MSESLYVRQDASVDPAIWAGLPQIDDTVAMPEPLQIAGSGSAHGRFVSVLPGDGSAAPAEGADHDEDDAPSEVEFLEVYHIAGSLPQGYSIRRTLPVHVVLEGEDFIAIQPQTDLHAFGSSSVDAIMQLRETLVDHFLSLLQAGDRIAPRLRRQRELLEQLIAPAPSHGAADGNG